MTKPNIQIDNLVREMTDGEYEAYLSDQAKEQAQKDGEVDAAGIEASKAEKEEA